MYFESNNKKNRNFSKIHQNTPRLVRSMRNDLTMPAEVLTYSEMLKNVLFKASASPGGMRIALESFKSKFTLFPHTCNKASKCLGWNREAKHLGIVEGATPYYYAHLPSVLVCFCCRSCDYSLAPLIHPR